MTSVPDPKAVPSPAPPVYHRCGCMTRDGVTHFVWTDDEDSVHACDRGLELWWEAARAEVQMQRKTGSQLKFDRACAAYTAHFNVPSRNVA